MEAIDFDRSRVQLVGGEVVEGDVVIGADGTFTLSTPFCSSFSPSAIAQ